MRRYCCGGRTHPASSQVRRDLPWVEAYGNTEDAPGRVFATLCADREGGPGPCRHEPARGLPQLRRPGGRPRLRRPGAPLPRGWADRRSAMAAAHTSLDATLTRIEADRGGQPGV